MEPESHAAAGDSRARLAKAQSSATSSALRITHALGSIIALTGPQPPANQPLWRRVDVFARADLGEVISPGAQKDIADSLRLLVSLHNRLTDTRWTLPTAHDSAGRSILTGHGGGVTTTTSTTTATTLESVELLADVFRTVAGSLESLDTRLTAQTVFTAPLPISMRAYVREIQAATARVSTQPDDAWTWESHLDAD